MPDLVAAVLLSCVAIQVALGGPRIEMAFEAGLIVGAGLVLSRRPR